MKIIDTDIDRPDRSTLVSPRHHRSALLVSDIWPHIRHRKTTDGAEGQADRGKAVETLGVRRNRMLDRLESGPMTV